MTTLALCYDVSRNPLYLGAMLRFAEFVANGTKTTPKCDFTAPKPCSYDSGGNESETTSTWLVARNDPTDPLHGALGDGYYMGRLNLPPYTIATATTGGAFFAEMHALTKRGDFGAMASKAVAFLLRNVQNNGAPPF